MGLYPGGIITGILWYYERKNTIIRYCDFFSGSSALFVNYITQAIMYLVRKQHFKIYIYAYLLCCECFLRFVIPFHLAFCYYCNMNVFLIHVFLIVKRE